MCACLAGAALAHARNIASDANSSEQALQVCARELLVLDVGARHRKARGQQLFPVVGTLVAPVLSSCCVSTSSAPLLPPLPTPPPLSVRAAKWGAGVQRGVQRGKSASWTLCQGIKLGLPSCCDPSLCQSFCGSRGGTL